MILVRAMDLSRSLPVFSLPRAAGSPLVKQLTKEGKPIPPRPAGVPPEGKVVPVAQLEESVDSHLYGTVGVVALDRNGNIAAGTSTGGLQGKMPGPRRRFADYRRGHLRVQSIVRVSATGTGEYFIRLGVAPEVCNLGALLRACACSSRRSKSSTKELDALARRRRAFIAITPMEQLAWSFNTPGMFRARWPRRKLRWESMRTSRSVSGDVKTTRLHVRWRFQFTTSVYRGFAGRFFVTTRSGGACGWSK